MNFKNLFVKMFGMFVPSCDYQYTVLDYVTTDMRDYYSHVFSEVLGYDCCFTLRQVRGRSFHQILMLLWAEGQFKSKEGKELFASYMVEYVVPIRIPLYRGIPDKGISSMGFACESWSKDVYVARRFGRGLLRRVYRVDYVYGIDLEKFMYGYADYDGFSHEREVIVFWRDKVQLFDKRTEFVTRRRYLTYFWESEVSEDMKKRRDRMNKKRCRLSK